MEDKRQYSAEKKDSRIISWCHELTKREKICLKVYIVWFLIHCALLGAGENEDGFFPWNSYGFRWYNLRCDWNVDHYGFPEFIVYVALIPVVMYFIYSSRKQNKNENKTSQCE